MKAKDLIKLLQSVPPDTPIINGNTSGQYFHEADASVVNVFRAPGGGFGQFTAEKLFHRNDTKCVAIH